MAKKMVNSEKSGDVKDAYSVDSKVMQASDFDALDPTVANKHLGGGDRAHDNVIKNALKETEVEESLKKAENPDGPDMGLPEKYRPDGYSDHVAKRLVEEIEQEKSMKKAEGGIPYSPSSASEEDKTNDASSISSKGSGIKKLLEDSENDATFLQTHSRAPVSRTLV